ncbi:TBCC-domain-containing protein [Karstenula rhodostoma CBS 690.94]|uniref:TBCC-domain-containing protein n=1 Tax=Karstenula rhodostoma CBS 690.94 TaxID=1392251 RepID=A0A9P4PI22_9PLEO|nr:TBCC-domain-containing protein [Karstenula rhodostoma CBS 690.94]
MATAEASLQARPEAASKERFFRYFQREVIALQEQMSRLASTSPTERPDAIDHCLAGISRLSSEVKDASSYIPAYDQRTYGDAIKALQEKLQSVRAELGAGPKKFKFTTKKNRSATSIGEAAEMAQNRRLLGPGGGAWDSSAGSSAMHSAFSPTPLEKLSPGEEKRELEALEQEKNGAEAVGVKVEDRDGEHVVLPTSEAQSGSSAVVSNVKGSVVDLSAPTMSGGSFATLTLKNIQGSLVVTGRVAGPIHMTDLENSVIITSCRQFRMHGSKKVDVYLHCSSRPIIEDCEDIRFAPLSQIYMAGDLASSSNQWDQIDDFKWLKAEASPHWSILPESKRIQEDVWKHQLSGQEKQDPDSILRAFGVSTSP